MLPDGWGLYAHIIKIQWPPNHIIWEGGRVITANCDWPERKKLQFIYHRGISYTITVICHLHLLTIIHIKQCPTRLKIRQVFEFLSRNHVREISWSSFQYRCTTQESYFAILKQSSAICCLPSLVTYIVSLILFSHTLITLRRGWQQND